MSGEKEPQATVLPSDLNLIGLLLILKRLQAAGRPLGHATILPFAAVKLPGVEQNYDLLLQVLFQQELASGTGEAFTLTPAGASAVAAAAQEYSLQALFYNEYYRAAAQSGAHAEFCERVYGKNLAQHGMTGMDQLHLLLTTLGVGPGTRLLDFGCGDGRITEYISDTTGAVSTGVDIAGEAIALGRERTRTRRDRLSFHRADIETGQGDFPPGPFDAIIALDSIFFTADLHLATRALLDRLTPGGNLGVFYHARAGTSAGETGFARVLAELDLPYTSIDLSAANTRHWEQKKAVLLELAPCFEAEGNLFLLKNRLAECESDLGTFQRYLYLVQKQ